jgi:hypothetical protein
MEDLEGRIKKIIDDNIKPSDNSNYFKLDENVVQALTKLVEGEVRDFRNFCENPKYHDEVGGIYLATAYKDYLTKIDTKEEGK